MALASTFSPDLVRKLKSLNLTAGEYTKIVNNLGREPNDTELGMFSVLWSEHCCYKHSRHLLKKLPTQGPRIVQGPGENAGVVDVGDNIQIAFKVESHNHPTAVEPFEGAATGVGGILRDIFTMNARPIANLNALRFGPLSEPRNHYLFRRAVEGIAHYGNCVGVPTVAGEVFFDESYSGNPLVNAMTVGIVYDNEIMPSPAKGIGNPLLYIGSATGKDGMGGAAFASRELDDQSHEDRPAVQVGDPFSEKLLIEACLEAFKTGCVVAAQDMGAAGLTSSSCEMADKGKVGICIDLDKVPAREPNMEPYEYLLSESQERMLFVLEKGKEQPVLDVFAKWHVPAVIVGEVIEGDNVVILHKGERVVDLPVALLTRLAPNYERTSRPETSDEVKRFRAMPPLGDLPDIAWSDAPEWLDRLMQSTNIANPKPVFRQYDRHVQNNTLLASEHLAPGVIRLRNKENQFSGKALAMTLDCNSRYVTLNPYVGTLAAVSESVRNLVCVGAQPIAVTNNLNFGNPEKDDIYFQMFYAVEGMKDACQMFGTPVTGGNVSLYNEHSGAPILPAPVIGMIGLLEDDTKLVSPAFKQPGHKIALIGRFKPGLGGTEYQKLRFGELVGNPPDLSLNTEKTLMDGMLKLNDEGLLQSAQDVSMGGLLVTLSECAFQNNLGVTLDLTSLETGKRVDELLFGETNGTYLVSYRPEDEDAIRSLCPSRDEVGFYPIGEVQAEAKLQLNNLSVDLQSLKATWESAFPKL